MYIFGKYPGLFSNNVPTINIFLKINQLRKYGAEIIFYQKFETCLGRVRTAISSGIPPGGLLRFHK